LFIFAAIMDAESAGGCLRMGTAEGFDEDLFGAVELMLVE